MELYEKIRREYFEGVGTILGVAKKLGVHRRMVREAVEKAIPPKRKKRQGETTRLISEVVLFVHQILTADQQTPRKQRHTAQRIYERLREEMPQQEVSPRSVRRVVQGWKQQHKLERAETYISQQYDAGREAQVDWYEAYGDLGGERVKLQVFCMRSMYSGAAFHRAYLRATQQAFLDGHIRAFELFGGVGEAFLQEQSQLTKRPEEDFEINEAMGCIVDAGSCVRVKYNRYSTPLRPGVRADVNIDASHITVYSQNQQIARHERCYQVRQEVLALEHYLAVLEYKPGALAHSKALAQYKQAGLWPDSFDQFWKKERRGQSQGTREMIRLLQLMPARGNQQVRSAIEAALACGSSDASTVLHLLTPDTQGEHRAAPLIGTGACFERPLPKLDVYGQLLTSKQRPEVRA